MTDGEATRDPMRREERMKSKMAGIIALSMLVLLVMAPSATQAGSEATDVVSVFSRTQESVVRTSPDVQVDRHVLFGPLPYKKELGVTMLVVSNFFTGEYNNLQTVRLVATKAGPYQSAADCRDAQGETVMSFAKPAGGETLAIPMAQPLRISAPPLGRISLQTDFWCLTATAHVDTIINIAAYESP